MNIHEKPGGEFEALLILEPIIFTDISAQRLNEGKYEHAKRMELAKLLYLLAKQNKKDVFNDFDLILMKVLLCKSVLDN